MSGYDKDEMSQNMREYGWSSITYTQALAKNVILSAFPGCQISREHLNGSGVVRHFHALDHNGCEKRGEDNRYIVYSYYNKFNSIEKFKMGTVEVYVYNGSYIKDRHYIAKKYSEKLGYEIEYKEALYENAVKESTSVLGEKKKYSVTDAMRYFQTKYEAVRIPWEYSNYYVDPANDRYGYSPCRHDPPDDMFRLTTL